MNCPECKSQIALTLDIAETDKTYHWRCQQFPFCQFDVDTHIAESPLVSQLGPEGGGRWYDYLKKGGELAAEAAKAKMPLFLAHFVGCTWGVCYLTMYARVIKPYLDDPAILDMVLRSGVIKDKGNTVSAPNGARIYYELFQYLMNVESDAVKVYLRRQFPQYFEKFKAMPFVLNLDGV